MLLPKASPLDLDLDYVLGPSFSKIPDYWLYKTQCSIIVGKDGEKHELVGKDEGRI